MRLGKRLCCHARLKGTGPFTLERICQIRGDMKNRARKQVDVGMSSLCDLTTSGRPGE